MSDEDPTGREDTDESLATERHIADVAVERRMTDEQMDRWRDAHVDEAVREARKHAYVVPPAINWAVIVLVLLWMAVITQQVISSTNDISAINQRQIALVQQQNDAQLCAQHDIVDAVKKIGNKLGLPVTDIVPPNTEGIACP